MFCLRCLFCFKQKTAYEMRISDWSSDVCSSDLLGQAARNFGLAAARGAYHQDVLGRHFVPKRVGQALPPPAVAQRHGDSPLGLLLTDNMFVQRGHNGSGGKGVVHHLLLFPFVPIRSEEHTSELQSLMRISYAVFCLKKKNT